MLKRNLKDHSDKINKSCLKLFERIIAVEANDNIEVNHLKITVLPSQDTTSINFMLTTHKYRVIVFQNSEDAKKFVENNLAITNVDLVILPFLNERDEEIFFNLEQEIKPKLIIVNRISKAMQKKDIKKIIRKISVDVNREIILANRGLIVDLSESIIL